MPYLVVIYNLIFSLFYFHHAMSKLIFFIPSGDNVLFYLFKHILLAIGQQSYKYNYIKSFQYFNNFLLLSVHFVRQDGYWQYRKNDLCFLDGTHKHKLHNLLHGGSALNIHSTCNIPSLNKHGSYYEYDCNVLF